MKTGTSLLIYTVLRLAVFLAPLALLIVSGVSPWIATIIAAVFGFAVSYIFLRRPRERVSSRIYEARQRKKQRDSDDQIEDAALDNEGFISSEETTNPRNKDAKSKAASADSE